MGNIEVEIRSFITKEKYLELIERLKKEGEFLGEDYQETHYFDAKEDLRIQRNNFFSKIWMKKGKIHDSQREEIEIKFARDDFEKLERIFLALGFSVSVKWFRTRRAFKWQGIDVAADFTKGYGYIIELEKMSDEGNKKKTLEMLKQKMKVLGIPLTPKDEFDGKYQYYRKNWRKLVGETL
ncbi:CYTH domain-containing protein [archaeon]|nr:MAG: CYTH domain-containing protein [archaeon]